MTAGYDPYKFVTDREEKDFLWEQSRPACDCCNDRILGECAYEIGDKTYCEDCINNAWSVIDRNLENMVREIYGSHVDYTIIEDIVDQMLRDFDLETYKQTISKEL